MEYGDIYDENQKRTGKKLIRGEKPKDGEYIQAAVAIVCNNGYVLVTKRHPSKTQGGMWEFPGGGGQTGEEAIDTLYRELEEETGIRPYKEQVTFLKTVLFAPYHLFLQVYLVESEVKMNQLKLQESEITDAMFVTPAELEMMVPMLTPMDKQIYEEVVAGLFSEESE